MKGKKAIGRNLTHHEKKMARAADGRAEGEVNLTINLPSDLNWWLGLVASRERVTRNDLILDILRHTSDYRFSVRSITKGNAKD